MVKKSVDITEDQQQYLDDNHINFSSWVRDELRKAMKQQEFEEKREKAIKQTSNNKSKTSKED